MSERFYFDLESGEETIRDDDGVETCVGDRGDCNDFLHILGADQGRNNAGAGTRDVNPVSFRSKAVLDFQVRKEFQHFLCLAGVMTLIGLSDNLSPRRQQNVLAGRAADIEAAYHAFVVPVRIKAQGWALKHGGILIQLDIDKRVS